MTIAVRPASSRSKPRSIVFSVRTSTFEVASSRIRMRGSASSARAKATSWRRPADSCTPAALAPPGPGPVRQGGDELARADRGDRRLDLLLARLGPAEGDVLAHAAREEEALLGDDDELAAQVALARPAPGMPRAPPAAALGVVEARDQLGERRLARAGGADQRERLPR